jgi:ABC-type dipeptide/oligopeptide/nickel transport system permease component
MAFGADAASRPAEAALSSVVRELLLLALTLLVGALFVVALVYLPRALIIQPYRPSGWAAYLGMVTEFLQGVPRGDFGRNDRGAPVNRILATAVLRSLQLLGASFVVALALGIGWGALLASARRGLLASILFGLNTLLISLPSFVVLLLAIDAIATLNLRYGIWLTYVQGYGLDRHLILPGGVLALRGAAFLARAVQVAQEDVQRQDWLRAARARGLSGWSLWRRHVLPALRLPLLGSTLGMLRVMVSALVIIEYMYNWGGLGQRLIARNGGEAIAASAGLVLVVFFVLVDLLGRMLLRRADPRLREALQES